MEKEVALEALGAFCNATVTSVQRHGGETPGGSSHSVPFPLTVNNFAHTIWRGEEFCSVQEEVSAGFTSPQESVKPVSFLSIDIDEDSRGNFRLEVDEDEFFDKNFNYDFTNITDQQTFYRGEEVYERPWGWKRFGLKVLGKYDDDTWLGNNMRTTDSVAGEWPVSYHGTSREGAGGIIPGHYKPGHRDAYGRGIYSAPDISDAEAFTREFQSKITGKQYEALLQNRINPKHREKHNHDKYWLVKIPEGTSKEEEKEMVDRAIRPYGLLLREIKPTNFN